MQSRIETIPRRRTAPAPPPSRRTAPYPHRTSSCAYPQSGKKPRPGVAAMKKPGLTGLKLEHGLSLPTEWTSFSIRSGEAVRNHFKHSVERLDGDGEIADHSACRRELHTRKAIYEERDSRGQRQAMTTITMPYPKGAFLVTGKDIYRGAEVRLTSRGQGLVRWSLRRRSNPGDRTGRRAVVGGKIRAPGP